MNSARSLSPESETPKASMAKRRLHSQLLQVQNCEPFSQVSISSLESATLEPVPMR